MEWKAAEGGADRAGESTVEKPSDRARWIAAASYIAFLSFFSLWKCGKNAFVKYHASQGFLLFLAECAALVFLIILDLALGKIRIVGLIAIGVLEITVAMGSLALSAIGFVKALFGEYWSMPFLGQYRDRVPGFHWQEG